MPGISARFVPAGPKPVFEVDFGIDGHSHIQSGATAPLPLLWGQTKPIRLKRTHLDTAASFLDVLAPFIMKGGRLQKLTTEEIADVLASDVAEAYGSECKLREARPFNRCKEFFTPIIIMLMDMDYAQIAGFPSESAIIYHEGKFKKWVVYAPEMPPEEITVDGVYFYDREDALAPENKGVLVDITHERPNRVWIYQDYKKQLDSTKTSVKNHPWVLIPMFHYDPRRWRNPATGVMDDKNWLHGPWSKPFEEIATKSNAGIFIGFKMYPPLGYKPLDHRLPHLNDYYKRCEAEGIPILTHCSPGGMTTHEAEFYHKLDRKELKPQPKVDAVAGGTVRQLGYDPAKPDGYFFDEYVHPKNWRTVLEKYPKLKLCLAHFGGDEWKKVGIESDWIQEIVKLTKEFPNVYTDMSCFNLKDSAVLENVQTLFREMRYTRYYQHLQDKVIFGIDWYLSIITKAPEYKEYVESFFDNMTEIDPWQWYRSALVNPATFYGLDDHAVLRNMNKALTDNLADRTKRLNGYTRIKTIKEQVETMRRELAKTKPKAKE
jgi:predicted TIM-barrel fold metal-dependent hydrolase